MLSPTSLAPRQSTLAGCAAPARNPGATEARIDLGEGAWIDWIPGWLDGGDALFDRCAEELPWGCGERVMYDRIVAEPRLTATLGATAFAPLLPRLSAELSGRYRRRFDRIFANFYRDGSDSVAWHGDRIRRIERHTVIPVLSLGGPRTFALRPRGGGTARRFDMYSGDLLVMGGAAQHTHEHAVPKRRHAQPRISLTFRGPDDARKG